MAFRLFLLAVLVQVAYAEIGYNWNYTCLRHEDVEDHEHREKPSVWTSMSNDCHEVLNVLSQFDPSGYITIQPHTWATVRKGMCEGSINNMKDTPIRFNQATLVWGMRAYIFDSCLAKGLYGKIWDDEKTALLIPDLIGKPDEKKRAVTSD